MTLIGFNPYRPGSWSYQFYNEGFLADSFSDNKYEIDSFPWEVWNQGYNDKLVLKEVKE